MQTLKLMNNGLCSSSHSPEVEISFDEWRAANFSVGDKNALAIDNDVNLQDLTQDVSAFDVIILEIPHFKDGRAYSQARRLREQHKFTGEIRARGDVGRDQVLFLVRSGFTAFEIPIEQGDGFKKALKEFSQFYQAGADMAEPVWRLRSKRAIAA